MTQITTPTAHFLRTNYLVERYGPHRLTGDDLIIPGSWVRSPPAYQLEGHFRQCASANVGTEDQCRDQRAATGPQSVHASARGTGTLWVGGPVELERFNAMTKAAVFGRGENGKGNRGYLE